MACLSVNRLHRRQVLMMQISSLIDLDVDKMLVSGLGAGHLHDLSDLRGLREGHVLSVKAGDPRTAAPPAAPAGGITLDQLSSALQAAMKPKSREQIEREQGMQEMQQRIMSSAQHVLIYEDKQVRPVWFRGSSLTGNLKPGSKSCSTLFAPAADQFGAWRCDRRRPSYPASQTAAVCYHIGHVNAALRHRPRFVL